MKQLKYLIYLLSFVFALYSCNSDDDNNGDGGSGTAPTEVNANRNVVTTDAAVARLEFPKLKGGNSIVLVNRTTGDKQYDRDEVNYCVEWDCDKKAQRWSCYQMHRGYTGNYSRVVDGYLFDPKLSSSQYLDKDYFYGSGFDHGHICPNADRKYSYKANEQTFYLTNMQPQYRKFNGYSSSGQDQGEGLWVRMEDKVRSWSPNATTDTLYVCKGGTIDKESNIIKRVQGKLIVPKYFFMACLLKNSQGYRAIAFWAEQKNEWKTYDDLADYAITIDELEQKTGIDFFCNLPDKTENEVESKIAIKAWGL
ncbi:DNA/RNA non-specific endonuclease [Prevotella sp. HCN-7019]|uniref:DNA/RNA non-specific endonuclease n=1 Tax=Prevotella sp. HCN-7019 TaxID=3134668 RepID=UPI0030C3AB37